jgi:hypothetical protein
MGNTAAGSRTGSDARHETYSVLVRHSPAGDMPRLTFH